MHPERGKAGPRPLSLWTAAGVLIFWDLAISNGHAAETTTIGKKMLKQTNKSFALNA